MDPRLESLEGRFGGLTNTLNSSPTARPGEQMPTMRDVRTEQQIKKTLEQIEGIKDAELRKRWYGEGSQEEKSDTAASPVGLFNRTIDALTAPLYAGIGAIDYATGQSRGRSLTEAMNENVSQDRRLWGDVLKGTGLPGVIAKPVGLTLDVVTDPINVLTAGTGGILARMAIGGSKGFAKSGISGAARGVRFGAESRALEAALVGKALTLGGTRLATKLVDTINPMRFINKNKPRINPTETTARVATALERRATKATKEFDEIVGKDAIQRAVEDRTLGGFYYRAFDDAVKKVGQTFPAAKEFADKYLMYDNKEWSRVARIRDALLQHSTNDQVDAASKAFLKTYRAGGSADEAFESARNAITLTPEDLVTPPPPSSADEALSAFDDPSGAISISKEEVDKIAASLVNRPETSTDELLSLYKVKEEGDEAAEILRNPQTHTTLDPLENEYRLFVEATDNNDSYKKFAESLQKMIDATDVGQTGVAWWDNMRASVNKFKQTVKEKKSLSNPNITVKERVGEKTAQFLDVYDFMMAAFKRSKVGASLRAWTNSILGNLAMAKLNGIDVLDPDYSKSFRQALNVVTGKTAPELLLNDLANVSDLIPLVRANPSQFELTTGLYRGEVERIAELRGLVQRFKKIGIEGGVLPKTASDDSVLDMMEQIMKTAGESVNATDQALRDVAETMAKRSKERISTAPQRKLASVDPETGRSEVVLGTDIVTNEFFNSEKANKFFKRLSDQSKQEGNYAAKLGNLVFNTMPENYGKIDHVYKLSNIIYTTKYGVKEHEMRQIVRALDITNPEDVTEFVSNGVTRYRLSAAKSFELANDTFLNYNAMPAAVKLIRQMPLVGAPFVAFTYGMYGKVLKGLLRNPAFFSKQHYALEEMSADTTPVEKALLAMERYQYLNDPAMVKVNFPGNNMVYVNAANVLPYLSLSLVQPTSRSFEEVLPNTVVQAVDRSPFMKDPVGSMIFDYFVLPALISEEVPLGAFGQPIYPADPSLGERAFYPARTLADAFMPGIVEQGLGTIAPAAAAPVMPGYLTRKMLYAKEGKTPVGIQSKEPATSRFGRAFLSGLGVPIQTPVPHEYLQEEEIADKLNQQ